mgnify:CR=1 FL=1
MPKQIKNVFYQSLTFSKFIDAHNRSKKNKMFKNEVLLFDLNLETNIVSLIDSIKDNTYKIGNYHSFRVYEPKERIIQSLPYRDRVVHQWYVEEFIKPYILPKFIYSSFACLPNKGIHKATQYVQNMMRKYQKKYPDYYILKCDIKKYFNSINPDILFKILNRYISDKALLQFTKKLIFENRPFNTPQGIPIGNYTSQYFANIYLNELDQYVKRTLHIHEYVRYMDDFIILQKDKTSCINLMQVISRFLKTSLNLELNHKSKYYPNKMGVNFCGYRIFSTHKLLRNSSKKKIKRHVKKWNKSYKANSLDFDKTMLRLNSWLGHSSHSNSYNLQQKILAKCDFLLNDKAYDKFEKNILDDLSNLS